MTGPGRAVRATELFSHPRADITLIGGPTAPALSLGWGTLFRGQDGFHFGYPRGQPGDVHGELMGRIKVRGSRVLEPGILWAEIEREPSNDLPLGGLSGGPVLGPGGDVIGLAIAASPRRGRVTSAAPESLHDVMARAGLRQAAAPARPPVVNVAASNYAAFGDQLRQRMSVARILCWDRDAASRRPGLR